MVRIIILLIVLSYNIKLYSQNLVLNPSFEDYWYLPQIFTKKDTFFCKHWHIPHLGFIEYYHKLSKIKPYSIKPYSVPENMFGKHPAKSGDAYIGLSRFDWGGCMAHVTGKLQESLKKGHKYKVSFYVRYAGNACYFYLAPLGVYFSKSFLPLNSMDVPFYDEIISPDIKAHVKNNENILLNKDSTWTLISGYYTAKGGEQYITIGMFYEEKVDLDKIHQFIKISNNFRKREKFYRKNQDILVINPNYVPDNNFERERTYYFIDDVCVELVDEKNSLIIKE